jgi:cyclophilin family peptidyl-prolyl cis-trans isomerase/HEAT repeat protein
VWVPEAADSLSWVSLLRAEDGRAQTDAALEGLVGGLGSEEVELRRLAVRAVGRLERADLVDRMEPLLTDSDSGVRAEAANAMAQSALGEDADHVAVVLLQQFTEELDPSVRGVIAQSLGRLQYASRGTMRRVEASLVEASQNAEWAAKVGIARGLESLLRLNRRSFPPTARTVERLYSLAQSQSVDEGDRAVRVRRLAIAALGGGGRVDTTLLQILLDDEDVEVRRLAATAASTLVTQAGRESVIAAAIEDPSPAVRYAALQVHARQTRPGSTCDRVVQATSDSDPHVMLLAIDLLAGPCADAPGAADLLTRLVEQLPPGETDSWHRAARALVALAEAAPGRATEAVTPLTEHEVWWVRMYAARAATSLDAVEDLAILAYDDHDNVREAAITGLFSVVGHEADSILIAQLARPDYQLVITATRLLEGTSKRAAAVPALLTALERITSERRETSRDPRRALLTRLEELAGRAQADYLASYLSDFDPVIAQETARILTSWTSRSWVARPRPLRDQSLPTYSELKQLAESRAVIEMRGGGSFELQLLPFDAPTNAARFARLAREGYFDELTFHRVMPGFVIQGGSPGANEFMGDGPYTRDELVKESHLRGTVGLSTRGRDTGDGQIFVNLVDNVRLDHNYTIFAEVVEGMETVDAILEGAVIERIVFR